ncbi:bifunctional 23S rRNA (guanine(2069)-N(7))-methyltransferase RlmK/23S rRNA (guanine(2445)-N(2))-methyltransferase RlmL [Motiliproteus sp. SC1-56]|uniref:bifunctional 23S rRNA (guanine(2069)-N(7))-methyltransferase RlmK/23S rRNA (guanine(2445)-N(2))-methyltransferase RlmL n=1 Tax=Motiliproteus sp. SC1-56 TaxID=2799565 RepID=UPI00351C7D0C
MFISCPKGLETLLAEEVSSLGGEAVTATAAGVYCEGGLALAYRICLWSRLANRVLLPLAKFPVDSAEDLYRGVQSIEWLEHLRSTGTLLVGFVGTSRGIKNTHFGALKVKDAIVDQVRSRTGARPSIDKATPDLRINLYLSKGEARLSLDLSGESLHRRGYRSRGGAAPLKENLAAALLLRSGWPAMAAEQRPLIDPMCGSGTLLIEAALMAAGIAPGLLRQRFGFENWLKHEPGLWQQLLREARQARLAAQEATLPEIHGYDANPEAVSIARGNIQRAGMEKHIRVSQRELADLKPLTHKRDLPPGLLLTNPPYGERLSETPVIVYLYRHLGQALRAGFEGWKAGVFTSNPDLGKAIGLRATKQYKLFNGALPSKLLLFDIDPAHYHRELSEQQASGQASAEGAPAAEAAAPMLVNRLRKNLKQLDKWARRENISCYRVYDADMPEYALAIDRYQDWVQVQEYAAPASVDPVKAMQRLEDAMAAIPAVMGVPAEKVVLKQRRRQSGREQYQRLDQQQAFLEVEEGGARLLVNLHDYLDTGLFLDHRPVRLEIQAKARDKRFLNLFCYTASASVHAALGGARSTTSVDLSNTYLEWARKNLALNGLSEKINTVVQADVLRWLNGCEEQFDLIFMDPPTFSNSKKMRETLDVQRDHVSLIRQAVARLAPGGELIFSNNLRRFRMDAEALADLQVEDITARTIDRDFARSPRIHNCWSIRRREERG